MALPMNPSRIIIRKTSSYSLQDVYRMFFSGDDKGGWSADIGNTMPMTDVLEDLFPDEEIRNRVVKNDVYLDALSDYIYERYFDWYIFKIKKATPVDPSDDEVKRRFREWISRFCYRYNVTFTRYSTLINYYNNEVQNLLDKIVTSTSIDVEQESSQESEQTAENTGKSENRFNDTPQIQNDGSLEDDPYLSQYSRQNNESAGKQNNKGTANGTSKTTQVSETDKETLMNRLDEVQTKLRDLWADWVDEFAKMFFYD